jgi:putative ABC transport system ATP-binding protein
MRERCHAEGAAFVIATHDSRLTRRCDRVLALLDGRLQAEGWPADELQAGRLQ